MFSWVFRVVGHFWTLVPVLAVVALVTLVMVSAFSDGVRRLLKQRGESALLSWTLLMALLLGQILTGALEPRQSGSSPLLGVPFFGGLLGKLTGNNHMDEAMLALSIVAIVYQMVRGTIAQKTAFSSSIFLLLLWVVLTTLVTIVESRGVGSSDRLALCAVATSGLAVLMLARTLTTVLLDRSIVILAFVLLLLNLWMLIVAREWSVTTAWPGGFLDGPRFAGSFPQPNVTGAVFACLGVYGAFARSWSSASRLFIVTGALYVLYLTGSRGGAVLAVAAFVYSLWLCKRLRLAQVAVVALLVATAAIPFSAASTYQVINGRDLTWLSAESIIATSPFLGHGVFANVGAGDIRVAIYAHNQFLQTTVETGLLGSGLLASAILVAIWSRKVHRDFTPLEAVFFGFIATFPFENPIRMFELPFSFLLSLFFISLVGVQNLSTSGSSEPQVRGEPVGLTR